LELSQPKYFQKIARMEHMTKAAEELRVAQPALSKTIAHLEKDSGVPFPLNGEMASKSISPPSILINNNNIIINDISLLKSNKLCIKVILSLNM
jgi:hypothetical protein